MMKAALTYDDITLIPQYSEVESRQNIDLTTQLTTNYTIRVPLIASPMDTVCDGEMAVAMANLGGVGCIHRFMSIEEQVAEVNFFNAFPIDVEVWDEHTVPIMAAVGANGDYLERAQELTFNGVNVILIDVAHGHHKFVKDALANLKRVLPSHVDIIAGNIATAEAAEDLQSWGADGLRVGVGGGSLCSTRVRTGFGVPNVSSLLDVASVATVPVIACGGIRNSGDIAKALAVGASSVILGSLLAGTKESPGAIIENSNGLYKRYRGAASLETKMVHGQVTRNVEGESTVVPFKGGVRFVVNGLLDGLRSALSYAGANSISTFIPSYEQVTSAGMNEARPHLL
jgi:IMP dehydrogenase